MWKGAISFGLVNIPVRLVTATKKNNIRFRYLHAECKSPIKQKRYCPVCEKDVDNEELLKGYEYEKERFVVLRDEDFDNLPVKSTRVIEIVDFVSLAEIDPVYYLKTYYLEPAQGGEKPYFLLKNSLDETNRVAISKIAIRKRESLAVVRTFEEGLALETMYFGDEVRSNQEMKLEDRKSKITISEKEEELAIDIINNLTATFEPQKYENDYREALLKIIRAKIEGEEVEEPAPKVEDNRVVDLMEKLRASVEQAEHERKTQIKDKREALH